MKELNRDLKRFFSKVVDSASLKAFIDYLNTELEKKYDVWFCYQRDTKWKNPELLKPEWATIYYNNKEINVDKYDEKRIVAYTKKYGVPKIKLTSYKFGAEVTTTHSGFIFTKKKIDKMAILQLKERKIQKKILEILSKLWGIDVECHEIKALLEDELIIDDLIAVKKIKNVCDIGF